MESKPNPEVQQAGATASDAAAGGAAPSVGEAQAANGGAPASAAPTQAADAASTKKPAKEVEVRVLIDCDHGRCNEVVTLPSKVAAQAVKEGKADDSAEAVSYAKSLAAGGEG